MKPNRRALSIAMTVPSTAIIGGTGAMLFGVGRGFPSMTFLVGVCLLGLGVVCIAALWVAARIPRLAYEEGELLVYLRSLAPLRVPVEVVECFFLGQGPTHLAAPDELVAKAANVIVRIAESAPQWHAREVRANLGHWSDGYITIRGMWCEPLSHERINQLNRRLAEAQRAIRTRQEVS